MLSDRQKMILSIVIDDYIKSAEPVGSRTISKRGDVGFSPATIRNEMSDLEELGYLEQPHTSSGRIPSHKGYRYYVDHLVQLGRLSGHELNMVKSFFQERMFETEQVFQQAAAILSNLTNYTSITLGPEIFTNTLKHVQLVPLNDGKAVAIIVTNTGHVENKTVTIPQGVSVAEIERFVNILNEKLVNIPLYQLKAKLYSEIGTELRKYAARYEELIRAVEGVLGSDEDHRVYLSGATNILTQPEFKDVDKVKTILDLLEETPMLMKLFSNTGSGIQVRIGTENSVEAINNCSLITATYTLEGKSLGTIGILGPTRMEYGKVISLLDYLSKDLAVIFSRWYK
jgi:heat-inducible transcriptional repressor